MRMAAWKGRTSNTYSGKTDLKEKERKNRIELKASKKYICLNLKHKKTFYLKSVFSETLETNSIVVVFSCSKCSFKSKHLGKFNRHKLVHNNKKSYLCAECFKTFKLAPHLKRHLTLHFDKNDFNCTECSFSTNRISLLKQHLINFHEKISCSQCSFSTDQSFHSDRCKKLNSTGEKSSNVKCGCAMSAWKRHFKIHTGKPFICVECDFKTISPSALKRHIRIHEVKKKAFSCKHCKFSSNYEQVLIKHLTPCPNCSYSTCNKNDLKQHLTLHNEPKAYSCLECFFSTEKPSYLIEHIRIHSKEKHFECTDCSFGSNYLRALKLHEETIH